MTVVSGTSQPNDIIKVLIVDDNPETQEHYKTLLSLEADMKVVGVASTGQMGIELAQATKPDVVLMDINLPDTNGIEATRAITEVVRTAAVVIVTVQSAVDFMQQAMSVGARGYLTKPVGADVLCSTIRNAYEQMESTRRLEARLAAALEARTAAEAPLVPGPPPGDIIVIYSPQGGAGTTTIATNVASALMGKRTKVVLVDCNLQFGNVHVFLDIQPQNTVVDLAKVAADADQETIERGLFTHQSGLRVLSAPARPSLEYEVTLVQVKELLTALARSYDFVVVDTPTQVDDLTLMLFEVASRIVLACNPTIPAVIKTRSVLDLLESLEKPAGLNQKMLCVLNRVVKEQGRSRGQSRWQGTLPTDSVERTLQHEVVATIPADEPEALNAANRGVPLVSYSKVKSPGRDLIALATHIRETVKLD
jgi:pilus assembly protein CpaE